jgi:hypothetical protein
MARPSDYDPKTMNKQVIKLARLGATDKEMSDFFEVSEVTLNAWKEKHPEFLKSLKMGKEESDANIAKSLYKRAKGFKHRETKVFCYRGKIITHDVEMYYPPDTMAIMYWLNNRRRLDWRQKQEIEHSGKIDTMDMKSVINDIKKSMEDSPDDGKNESPKSNM